MIKKDSYDLVIIGGGQAGLTLALQVKQAEPNIKIAIIEKQKHPLPEAAHKVGESVVEISSYYMSNMLGLTETLQNEMPKFGLRFFFTKNDNNNITERLEVGASNYLFVRAYHIDRGRFENALALLCKEQNIDFIDDSKATTLTLSDDNQDHTIDIKQNGEVFTLKAGWIVDASSRFSMLKRELKLIESNNHNVNSSWFRIDHAFEIDEWSNDKPWQQRVQQPRRHSTNHFMGKGYWLWFIPLANNRTSIGIVAEDKLHPLASIQTLEKSLAWIEKFEPECFKMIKPHAEKIMDFIVLKHFSHGAKQVFGANRWCITGEAGAFLDPFYSPGGDFIGMSNTFITQLILKQRQGEDITELSKDYDQLYRRLYRIFLTIYHRQYPIMGSARAMSVKIIWDFAVYWGCVAFIFFQQKLTDLNFIRRADPLLLEYGKLAVTMQSFFRGWSKLECETPPVGFLDYAKIQGLRELNAGLLVEHECDDAIITQLEKNLQYAQEIKEEIIERVGQNIPELSEDTNAKTKHLKEIFTLLEI